MSHLSTRNAGASALSILQSCSARAGPSTRPRIATSRSLLPSSSSTCPTPLLPSARHYATSQIPSSPATGSSSSTPTATTSRNATTSPSIPRPRPHQHPAFDSLSTSLSSLQPCFGARGDEIELLTSPQQFYAKLLEMIKRAKKRILISSLYIGSEESELVDAIRLKLKDNPHLRVTFILDYHRATRLSKPTTTKTTTTEGIGSESQTQAIPPSTAHLLLPLVREFSDRCEVWLFRSPKLRGIMEKIVPARFDEGWGTWHGKWYGVDDEVVISGANLASSYFTNRQDRYIHFRSHPSLLSYLSSLTRLFTQYSYLLHHSPPAHIPSRHAVPLPSLSPSSSSAPEASLIWPGSSIHPRSFAAHALATLTAFQNSWRSSNSSRLRRVDVDTWFWPVVQAGVLGIKEEEKALAEVWKAVADSYFVGKNSVLSADSVATGEKEQLAQAQQVQQEGERVEVDLTSGYFGLYRAYKKAVIDSPAPVRIIAASPKANGFYGSKGISKLIPEGYTLLESRFHQDTVRQGREWEAEQGTGVRLKEWEREGWTYHSKGLWLSPSRDIPKSNPFLTFVGSSNLSTRSLTLDTELSMILMTSSPVLRKALGNEVRALDQYTTDVGQKTWLQPERKVSWAAWILVALGVEGML